MCTQNGSLDCLPSTTESRADATWENFCLYRTADQIKPRSCRAFTMHTRKFSYLHHLHFFYWWIGHAKCDSDVLSTKRKQSKRWSIFPNSPAVGLWPRVLPAGHAAPVCWRKNEVGGTTVSHWETHIPPIVTHPHPIQILNAIWYNACSQRREILSNWKPFFFSLYT